MVSSSSSVTFLKFPSSKWPEFSRYRSKSSGLGSSYSASADLSEALPLTKGVSLSTQAGASTAVLRADTGSRRPRGSERPISGELWAANDNPQVAIVMAVLPCVSARAAESTGDRATLLRLREMVNNDRLHHFPQSLVFIKVCPPPMQRMAKPPLTILAVYVLFMLRTR